MKQIADRFWSKVDIRGPDECWPWLAAKSEGGYGFFSVGYTMRNAHRVAYALARGIDPATLDSTIHVLHSCDNRPCCNPAHLHDGTNAINMAEKASRGRCADFRGERHPNAVLTNRVVQRIRELAGTGYSYAKIGAEIGTDESNVGLIVRGKAWAHVPRLVRRTRIKI